MERKSFQSDNTVMVHIRKMREKIEEIPRKPRYIKTVWGVGYKMKKIFNHYLCYENSRNNWKNSELFAKEYTSSTDCCFYFLYIVWDIVGRSATPFFENANRMSMIDYGSVWNPLINKLKAWKYSVRK